MAKSVWADLRDRAPVWTAAPAVLDRPWFGRAPDASARVAALLERLAASDVAHGRARALVIGSGDGALAEALGAHFREVVGVDVVASPAVSAANVALHEDAPGDLSMVHGRFDLVYCPFVLSALPPKAASKLLLRLISHLEGHGAVVLTLLARASRRADRPLARAVDGDGRPPGSLRSMTGNQVTALVARSGLDLVASERRTGRYGTRVLEVVAARGTESARVLEGTDGWLFLDNDRNRVVAQHSGELLLGGAELEQWVALLRARTEKVRAAGGRYVHLAAPDAHAVWAERLPPSVPRGRTRPIVQLVERLAGEPVDFLYPLADMRAAAHSDAPPPYAANDTHWSAYGAWTAYRALLDTLGERPPARRLTGDDVEFVTERAVGDLGHRADPPRAALHARARVLRPQARLLDDNLVRNNGRVIRFACDAAPEAHVLVLGDSFTYAMLRFLSESWRRTTFVHLYTLDPELLAEERPDAVVTVLNERFHIRVPDDAGGTSARDWYARKAERGGVMSPEGAAVYSRKLGWP